MVKRKQIALLCLAYSQIVFGGIIPSPSSHTDYKAVTSALEAISPVSPIHSVTPIPSDLQHSLALNVSKPVVLQVINQSPSKIQRRVVF